MKATVGADGVVLWGQGEKVDNRDKLKLCALLR